MKVYAISGPDSESKIKQTTSTEAKMLRVTLAAAAYHARRVARSMRLSDIDREDIEQHILLVLLERTRFFDQQRGAWSSFADRVGRQAAQAVADEIGVERRVRGGSLDQPAGDEPGATFGEVVEPDYCIGPDPEDEMQLRLSLARFIAELPGELALVIQLALREDGQLGEARRLSGLSSSEFYRRLREVRYRLVCVGIIHRRFRADDPSPGKPGMTSWED